MILDTFMPTDDESYKGYCEAAPIGTDETLCTSQYSSCSYTVADIIEMIGSDRMFLFASDYPHWQFEGDAVLPDGLAPALLQRIRVDNPLETYPRLKETVQ